MRFGFVTCVQLGLSCMDAIYAAGGALDFALTLDDDMARAKSGRVYLDDFCAERAIPLVKARNINRPDAIDAIRRARLDWLFIIGWSQIAGPDVLAAPGRGVLGIHPTLLPQGRGRAAIPWAIIKGLDRTGVTLFKLDDGVDTGAILAQRAITLSPTTTATELYAEVDRAHVELIASVFDDLRGDRITLCAQDESGASVWPGRTPDDGRIDLQGSAATAERLIRAVTRPYPGAFVDQNGERLIIWNAATGEGRAGDPVLRFHDGVFHATDWERVPQ